MQGTPATSPLPAALSANALRKAIGRYYKELDEYKGKADYELALRSAFQNLLAEGARHVNWTLIPDQTIEGGILPQCFAYRLGNRSALDWVIDQYQLSEDKRSGIVSDPNTLDDEEYIVRLVGKVVTVSVETMRLVAELQQPVTMDDWR